MTSLTIWSVHTSSFSGILELRLSSKIYCKSLGRYLQGLAVNAYIIRVLMYLSRIYIKNGSEASCRWCFLQQVRFYCFLISSAWSRFHAACACPVWRPWNLYVRSIQDGTNTLLGSKQRSLWNLMFEGSSAASGDANATRTGISHSVADHNVSKANCRRVCFLRLIRFLIFNTRSHWPSMAYHSSFWQQYWLFLTRTEFLARRVQWIVSPVGSFQNFKLYFFYYT